MPRKAACRKPSDPTQSDQIHAGEAVGVQDELAEGQACVQGDVHPAPVGICVVWIRYPVPVLSFMNFLSAIELRQDCKALLRRCVTMKCRT